MMNVKRIVEVTGIFLLLLLLVGLVSATHIKTGPGYIPPESDDDYTPPTSDNSYIPPTSDDNYTPPASDDSYVPPVSDDSYIPPTSDQNYTPPASDNNYTPPTSDTSYVPPASDEDYVPPEVDQDYKPATVGPGYKKFSVGPGLNLNLGPGLQLVKTGEGHITVNSGPGYVKATVGDGYKKVKIGPGVDVLIGPGHKHVEVGDGVEIVRTDGDFTPPETGEGYRKVTIDSNLDVHVGPGLRLMKVDDGYVTITAGEGFVDVTADSGYKKFTIGTGLDVSVGPGHRLVRVDKEYIATRVGSGLKKVTLHTGVDLSVGSGFEILQVDNTYISAESKHRFIDTTSELEYKNIEVIPGQNVLVNSGHTILEVDGGYTIVEESKQEKYALSISIKGNGGVFVEKGRRGGTINIEMVEIDKYQLHCNKDCDSEWQIGKKLLLQIKPAAGYAFEGWEGDCNGKRCYLSMDSDKSVTAKFTSTHHTLKITRKGDGATAIYSYPEGIIYCGWTKDHSTCSVELPAGEAINLGFLSQPGSQILTVSEPCSGKKLCQVIMDSDKEIIVKSRITRDNITARVKTIGEGEITVTGPMMSIMKGRFSSGTANEFTCNFDCTAEFPVQKSITLTAKPSEGWVFAGWDGECYTRRQKECVVSNPLQDLKVSVKFVKPMKVKVRKQGGGLISSNSATSDPDDIVCFEDCAEDTGQFGRDTILQATPLSGFEFTGWTGVCGGQGRECLIPYSFGEIEVTAIFERPEIRGPPIIEHISPEDRTLMNSTIISGLNLYEIQRVMVGSEEVSFTNVNDNTIRLDKILWGEMKDREVIVVTKYGLSTKNLYSPKETTILNARGTSETCFGAVGKGCYGFDDDTGSIDPTHPFFGLVRAGCSAESSDGKRNCWVVPGSIKHDNCCARYPLGKMCGGTFPDGRVAKDDVWDGKHCSKEWDDAWADVKNFRAWPATFDSRNPNDLTPVASKRYNSGEVSTTDTLCAPDGTNLNAWHDYGFCCSGYAEEYWFIGTDNWMECKKKPFGRKIMGLFGWDRQQEAKEATEMPLVWDISEPLGWNVEERVFQGAAFERDNVEDACGKPGEPLCLWKKCFVNESCILGCKKPYVATVADKGYECVACKDGLQYVDGVCASTQLNQCGGEGQKPCKGYCKEECGEEGCWENCEEGACNFPLVSWQGIDPHNGLSCRKCEPFAEYTERSYKKAICVDDTSNCGDEGQKPCLTKCLGNPYPCHYDCKEPFLVDITSGTCVECKDTAFSDYLSQDVCRERVIRSRTGRGTGSGTWG